MAIDPVPDERRDREDVEVVGGEELELDALREKEVALVSIP